MNRCLALFALIVTLPVEAALLRLAMSDDFDADLDPWVASPVGSSHAPNAGAARAVFTDTLAPGGAPARDHFIGTAPPGGVPFRQRARVEWLDEPVLPPSHAELHDALATIEFGPLDLGVDLDDATIARITPLPEPGTLALTGCIALLALVRLHPGAPRRPNAIRRRSVPA